MKNDEMADWADVWVKSMSDFSATMGRLTNATTTTPTTKEPEMKYDLKAMTFEPDSEEETAIDGVWFRWTDSPEDYSYWINIYRNGQTAESAAKIQAMRDQFKAENLPDIGVLLEHDGSNVSPVAVGTDVTCWFYNNRPYRGTEVEDGGWMQVTHYLIHSYPEPKRIAGTVAEYTDTPDFDTWVADDAV